MAGSLLLSRDYIVTKSISIIVAIRIRYRNIVDPVLRQVGVRGRSGGVELCWLLTAVTETVVTTVQRQWTMKGVVGSCQAAPVTQRQQHTHPMSAGWKRLRYTQIMYLINVLGGRLLCYPSPSPRNLLLRGRRINCQPATCIPALPCLTRRCVRGDLSASYCRPLE